MNLHSGSKRKKLSSKKLQPRKSLDNEVKTPHPTFPTRPQSVMLLSTQKTPKTTYKHLKKIETLEFTVKEKPKLSGKKLLLVSTKTARIGISNTPITSKQNLQEWFDRNEFEEEKDLKDLLNALVFRK